MLLTNPNVKKVLVRLETFRLEAVVLLQPLKKGGDVGVQYDRFLSFNSHYPEME
jgi:hypothetical protein